MESELAILGGPKAVQTPVGDMFTWPILSEEAENAALEVLRRGAMSGIDVGKEFEAAGVVPLPDADTSEEYAVVLETLRRSLTEDPQRWTTIAAAPFSSARKWSAVEFADRGSWVLGAPEIVGAEASATVRAQADSAAAQVCLLVLLQHRMAMKFVAT